jgi:hypothetical protein
MELTHAGPKDVDREADLRWPSGVVCSDFVGCFHSSFLNVIEQKIRLAMTQSSGVLQEANIDK